MARAPKLKVYHTPIGFHDAYVAVPSQKAALEAWGSDANLFARGLAELVSDEELTGEPLAQPGKVIKRLRGSTDDHLAALSADAPRRKRTKGTTSAADKKAAGTTQEKAPPAKRKRKPKQRPSRDALEAAEAALEALELRQGEEDQALRTREEALQRERRDLEDRQDRERAAAEERVDRERKNHSDALDRWLEAQDG